VSWPKLAGVLLSSNRLREAEWQQGRGSSGWEVRGMGTDTVGGRVGRGGRTCVGEGGVGGGRYLSLAALLPKL
jgi:hypothetical protein